MTAEIAILNRSAVALAADSAVTITSSGGTKIYNSANKLLMLSEGSPVGVMAYGNAGLLGLPWEAVIKMFRADKGTDPLPRLDDYADSLLGFLNRQAGVWFSADEQANYESYLLNAAFSEVRNWVREAARERLETERSLSVPQLLRMAAAAIRRSDSAWTLRPFLEGYGEADLRRVARDRRDLISTAMDSTFESFPLSGNARRSLRRIGAGALVRFRPISATSGLVIAGFGSTEIYPSLRSFEVNGVADGRVHYVRDEDRDVAIHHGAIGAALVPFAQSSVVMSFMQGVDPRYHSFQSAYLEQILGTLPDVIAEKVPNAKKSDVQLYVGEVVGPLLDALLQEFGRFREDEFVGPVSSTLATMPKEEMAAMAEALVNLTSFRQKITMQDETVGGPIDVAVISKGDGFVWMRRKHYFDGRINPRFMAKYYR